jgi:catechol 2,3-dioxygenase-like lactoylglutathione lyase family enzyme
VRHNVAMLTNGFNHVAILTDDSDRFIAFYEAMFGAEVLGRNREGDFSLTFVKVGEDVDINLFEIKGNEEAKRQTPMFGRGRLDHLALQAKSVDAFDTIRRRLIEKGASDGFVTDFGPVLSLFFIDPDGLEAEVCVPNPDAVPGVFNPPGTPAVRYAS